jgi:hypothetical protein
VIRTRSKFSKTDFLFTTSLQLLSELHDHDLPGAHKRHVAGPRCASKMTVRKKRLAMQSGAQTIAQSLVPYLSKLDIASQMAVKTVCRMSSFSSCEPVTIIMRSPTRLYSTATSLKSNISPASVWHEERSICNTQTRSNVRQGLLLYTIPYHVAIPISAGLAQGRCELGIHQRAYRPNLVAGHD